MALNDEQLAVLSADIAANPDPTLQGHVAAGNHQAVADWYNTETESPDVWVLRSNVPKTAIVGSMDWANEYDPGFKDDMPAIDFITSGDGALGGGYDPRPVESRNALNAVFSGAGNSKAQILSVSVRICSKAEALYIEPTTGPGGGNGSAPAQAALATFEGNITSQDARLAIALIP